MKKSKLLFETKNLLVKEALHKIEVNFFLIYYWVGNVEKKVTIRGLTYSTSDIKKHTYL
jgi:hypothetical protein